MTGARHKRQPTADVMRAQLALAADEIIRLRGRLAQSIQPGEIVSIPTPAPGFPWVTLAVAVAAFLLGAVLT